MKDKTIAAAGSVTAVAALTALVATSPGLVFVVTLASGLYNIALELRKDRAEEYFKQILQHPGIFVEELVKTSAFADAAVYIFEKYIRERSEEKRKFIFNILYNGAKKEMPDTYEFERYNSTLHLITEEQISLFKEYIDTKMLPSGTLSSDYYVSNLKTELRYTQNEEKIAHIKKQIANTMYIKRKENENALVALGLLIPKVDETGVFTPDYIVTSYGYDFIEAIKYEHVN